MKLAIFIVILVSVIGLVLTFILVGKGETEYQNKTKKNVTNLTVIYVITTVGSLIALGIFISKVISH
jgi:hypothetical protein